jgi:hypothetical protein
MRLSPAVLVLTLCAAATLLLAAEARADDPLLPRAAIVVAAAEGTDPFVTAYLSEVAAGVLREEGFDVAPPNASREELGRIGRGALECVADDACASAFARRVKAPTLLFIETTPIATERIRVAIATATVRFGAIERAEPTSVEGAEARMAEPVEAAARALAAVERPCQVELAAPEGLSIELAVGGSPPVSDLPVFLPAGEHALVLRARGRGDARATLTCVAGRRYRVRVR